MSTTGRTVVVIGGNKGLGYEQVKQLAQAHPDWSIMLGSRTEANAQSAVKKMRSEDAQHKFDNVHFLQIEVTDAASIKAAVATMKKRGGGDGARNIDYFIYNAGIVDKTQDYDGALTTLNVNVFGVRNTIEAFLPLMKPAATGAKIIVVSSTVGAWSLAAIKGKPIHDILLNDIPHKQWADLDAIITDYLESRKTPSASKYDWPDSSKTYAAYGVSKIFVNAYCRQFALQHANDAHLVMVCPGYCATELNNFQGHRSAAVGGQSVIYPVDNTTESGHFYQDGKEIAFSTPMPENFGANNEE